MQISVDFAWSPHGIDGRHFDWVGLAAAADLIFLMMYDMQSQVRSRCAPWPATLRIKRVLLGQLHIASHASASGNQCQRHRQLLAARKPHSSCAESTNIARAAAVCNQLLLPSKCNRCVGQLDPSTIGAHTDTWILHGGRHQRQCCCIQSANDPDLSMSARTQIWGSCVASANTPLALMRRGLAQWLGLGIPADKLVLGLPW